MDEGLNLHIGDVDSQRMMVHIHRGKGAKDRYIPLPTSTLQMLREFWKTHRHPTFLFPADGPGRPGRRGRGKAKSAGRDQCAEGAEPTANDSARPQAKTPLSATAVQEAMKQITKKINFGKKVSLHTLRHSYATHSLEAGVSLRIIQQYLGHSSLQTTMVYLHLTETAEIDTRKIIETIFRRNDRPDGDETGTAVVKK